MSVPNPTPDAAIDGVRPPAPRSPARRRALATLGSAGLLAAGCGGTDLAGVGSGGTGAVAGSSFSAGAISGFGSVIVNGIKYEDGTATVTDDLGGARSLGQLGIGMVVEIEGTTDEATGVGVARSIRIVSEVAGAVTSVDVAAARLVVLGLVVQTGALTTWDDVRGIGSVPIGAIVEVWGFADRSTGVLRATRIELRPAGAGTGKLRGPVAGWDPVARTFRIGTQAIDGRGLLLPEGLADGSTVQVTGTRPAPGSIWRPDRVVAIQVALGASVTAARIEGTISGFQSAARFELAGLQVDASGAAFEDGTAAALRNGLRVRVTGLVSGTRVVAQRVRIRSDDDGAPGFEEVEVKGTITRFSLIGDFTVRDAAGRLFIVDATAVTRFEGLTASELRVGLQIQVKGRSGALLRASEIRLDR